MKDKVNRAAVTQLSNIWAMVSAAGFAAAFFQGSWLLGVGIGMSCMYFSVMLAIEVAKGAKKEKEDG